MEDFTGKDAAPALLREGPCLGLHRERGAYFCSRQQEEERRVCGVCGGTWQSWGGTPATKGPPTRGPWGNSPAQQKDHPTFVILGAHGRSGQVSGQVVAMMETVVKAETSQSYPVLIPRNL